MTLRSDSGPPLSWLAAEPFHAVLLVGGDGGARHWSVAMTLIQTAKLNGVDPMAWLTNVLERVVSGRTKAHELHTLLPWTWQPEARAGAHPPHEAIAA